MQKRHSSTKRQDNASSRMGGREFGNVIEPMQAQMASENRGLADDVGSRSTRSQQESHGKKTRKKGA